MLSQVSINQTSHSLRQGKSMPSELVNDSLERIEEWESVVQAWAYVDAAGARAAAAQLDTELAAGKSRGLLHGVPIGVKDIVAVKGMPTRAGSSLTSADPVERDAPAIERLRAAGAIILGKTITTEWACFDPPPTRNPWNLGHTPGGSSSGSAVAVAMGMCPVAVGSQTGGSIIRPGSYCGVYSCKPTHGAISLENVIPLSPEIDHLGAFARSIGELTPVILAMIGGEAADSCANSVLQRPPRIGVVEEYFYQEADPEVVEITRDAVEKLKLAGAQVDTVGLPKSFSGVHSAHRQMLAYRASRYHREQFEKHPAQFGPHVSAVINYGLAVTDEAFKAALVVQKDFQQELVGKMADFDALLTPATPASAPATLESTGDLKFNAPWSFSGMPVVSLPIDIDSNGMPLAIQLTGRSGSDVHLLSLAAWCEGVVPFRADPTGFKSR